jgi:tRNA-Thr(GGU) m(6)t(6)A37 methyltransferase TsaA
MKNIEIKPIGFVKTDTKNVPRHWTVSEAEGMLIIDGKYKSGLKDIKPGENIVVIFNFHQSPAFNEEYLIQVPPHRQERLGVFSTCSPFRPNPIGMSVLEVIEIEGTTVYVRGLDMIDGTPILDIKPFVIKSSTSDSSP